MKIFVSLAIILSGLVTVARASTCFDSISNQLSWNTLNEKQANCLGANADFNNGMAYLCSADQSYVSSKFSKYFEFQTAHSEAYEEFNAAKTAAEKNQAIVKLHRIERNWSRFGYRNETEVHLDELSRAYFSCTQGS
jgi:hypothetical protein